MTDTPARNVRPNTGSIALRKTFSGLQLFLYDEVMAIRGESPSRLFLSILLIYLFDTLN